MPASPPPPPPPACLCSKRRFDDEAAAARAARDSMLDGAPPLSVYFCMLCYGYHLTSSPARKGSRR